MPEVTVQAGTGKQRLDAWLATALPELSRARWQDLIRQGSVQVNGTVRKPNHTLHDGDVVAYTVPEAAPVQTVAQDLPLDILYEDADFLVINKQPGLVVHPAPGHEDGTLVNALLHHCTDLRGIGGELRPGIVHRLDRDTSGVLVVAKHEQAMQNLAAQFKDRVVKKEYIALVWGKPEPRTGRIVTLIGRNPGNRKKMSARVRHGREAVSIYEVDRQFEDGALVRVKIETGRTHQIRVHLAHIGHPVMGDQLYGRARPTRRALALDRQMLHARQLTLRHPSTGKVMTFAAPVPGDMQRVVETLSS